MDPNKKAKESTKGSALGFLLVGVAIVAVIAAIILIPNLFENLVLALLIIVVAIALIAIGIALLAGILAIPMYAMKGAEYQTDMSYDIDDVKEVDGKMEAPKKD